MLRHGRKRQFQSESLQDFEVEDISVEPTRVESVAMPQPRALVIPPTQISNSVDDLPELRGGLPCLNTVVAANSQSSVDASQARELSPMSIRTAPPVVNLSELSSGSPCSSVVPDLETAITIASKIESELFDHSRSSSFSSSRPVVTSAKMPRLS